jgi:hypothetical protein
MTDVTRLLEAANRGGGAGGPDGSQEQGERAVRPDRTPGKSAGGLGCLLWNAGAGASGEVGLEIGGRVSHGVFDDTARQACNLDVADHLTLEANLGAVCARRGRHTDAGKKIVHVFRDYSLSTAYSTAVS